MKKSLTMLAAIGFLLGLSPVVSADPASDLKEFQGFYKKKFPEVPFDDYADGVYAFDKKAKQEWQTIMEFPPFEIEMEDAKAIWKKPFKNGKTFASCFKNGGANIAQNYPYWDAASKSVRTLEADINECLKRNGEEEIKDYNKGKLIALTAYLKSMSRGQRVKLDMSNPGMVAAYEKGKKFYWARRGQLNVACSHCHIDNASKFIRGDSISAGLGHGVAWPTYRAGDGQLTSLHNRYQGCNKQVRAKDFKAQSPEYIGLEVYETYMNTGLPLTAPGYRR